MRIASISSGFWQKPPDARTPWSVHMRKSCGMTRGAGNEGVQAAKWTSAMHARWEDDGKWVQEGRVHVNLRP